MIQNIEKAVGHPLQWFICLLHTNELPLRHLFQTLEGPTTGPTSSSGGIWKAIQSCESLPIAPFQPIADGEGLPDFSTTIQQSLSRDQQYLYKIIQAVRQGHVSQDLARQRPGPVSHSRWITLACRVCQLYVALEKPSVALQRICHFVVTNYAPNWFAIKCRPSCCDGPKHLHAATQLVKLLPKEVADIVKPYIARNAYYVILKTCCWQ